MELLDHLLATAFLELVLNADENLTDVPNFSPSCHFTTIHRDQWAQDQHYKTPVLCINTPASICKQLHLFGTATHNNAKHPGILLGKTIESTVVTTMEHIKPKATTPPLRCYTELHSSSQLCSMFIILSFWFYQW
jgi:hypothetical protein